MREGGSSGVQRDPVMETIRRMEESDTGREEVPWQKKSVNE